eukprot:TRINITY_DN14302_c0_g1_i1.p1 TRINITY_DN14302_c0_g1~~TRINITY_DN14302_c0_g1_i1.p1  ORF type:complete len:654 (+),score=132.40 TRINITY_DN14302_c0_g1_i1:194-2155(+)
MAEYTSNFELSDDTAWDNTHTTESQIPFHPVILTGTPSATIATATTTTTTAPTNTASDVWGSHSLPIHADLVRSVAGLSHTAMPSQHPPHGFSPSASTPFTTPLVGYPTDPFIPSEIAPSPQIHQPSMPFSMQFTHPHHPISSEIPPSLHPTSYPIPHTLPSAQPTSSASFTSASIAPSSYQPHHQISSEIPPSPFNSHMIHNEIPFSPGQGSLLWGSNDIATEIAPSLPHHQLIGSLDGGTAAQLPAATATIGSGASIQDRDNVLHALTNHHLSNGFGSYFTLIVEKEPHYQLALYRQQFTQPIEIRLVANSPQPLNAQFEVLLAVLFYGEDGQPKIPQIDEKGNEPFAANHHASIQWPAPPTEGVKAGLVVFDRLKINHAQRSRPIFYVCVAYIVENSTVLRVLGVSEKRPLFVVSQNTHRRDMAARRVWEALRLTEIQAANSEDLYTVITSFWASHLSVSLEREDYNHLLSRSIPLQNELPRKRLPHDQRQIQESRLSQVISQANSTVSFDIFKQHIWPPLYEAEKVLKSNECLLGLYREGSMHIFLRRDLVEKHLPEMPVGTFIIRFSDNDAGVVTIGAVAPNSSLRWYKIPANQVRNIADFIRDSVDFHVVYCRGGMIRDKQQAIGRYYSSPSPRNASNGPYQILSAT